MADSSIQSLSQFAQSQSSSSTVTQDPFGTSSDLNPSDPLYGITGGAPTTRRSTTPLGVPKGYVYRGTHPLTSDELAALANGADASLFDNRFSVNAQYFKGDEWGLASGFPSDASGVINLQQQLLAAHLYSGSLQVVKGQWDQESANAFARLLAVANASGQTWQDALAQRLDPKNQANLLNPANTRAARLPLVVKLTNPDDIKAVAQDSAKRLYGTYMSDADLQQFTQNYQAAEKSYQEQSYAATGYNPETGLKDFNFTPDQAGTGTGSATALTAPATGAGLSQELDAQIRNANPQQFQSNAFTGRLGTILDALKGAGPTSAASPQ